MARQLSGPLESGVHLHEMLPSAKQVGFKTKLLRTVAMLAALIAGNTRVHWKKVIFLANLVKRRAVWNFKDFYTGSPIKDIDLAAEAQTMRRKEVCD
jgi:hypothetical protein